MATQTDRDVPTMDQSAGSDYNQSGTSHAPEQHIVDPPLPESTPDAQAPAKEPSSPPQVVEPPAKPIAETPVSLTSDDEDFVPRGKTTQTIAGGGKKGTTRPR